MFQKATGGDPVDARTEGCRRVPRGDRSARVGRQAWRAAGAVPGELQERTRYARLPGVAAAASSRTTRSRVELRHRSWSDDPAETLQLLDAFGAAWVQIDEPKFRVSIRQNLLPEREDLLLPAAARPERGAVVEARQVGGSLQLSVLRRRVAAVRGGGQGGRRAK